jgi:hypothetical protein
MSEFQKHQAGWAPPTYYLSIYPLMVADAHPPLKNFYNERVQ